MLARERREGYEFSMGIRGHHTFMVSFTRSLLKGLFRPVFAYLVTLSLTLIAFCSLGIYFLERQTNPGIASIFDAAYYSVTIMTSVGLGDIVPVTTGGRILSMAMMLSGTAIFVSFTATLAAVILEIELDHRARR